MATYYGDAYDNLIGAYTGPNTIYGGAGNDTIFGYTDADRLSGDDGNDQINGWFGNDTIYGGNGNDFIDGWENNDLISGESGNDTIYGGNNADTIYGGSGDDEIYGDDGAEVGQDVITGGAGNDTLCGGCDNDSYYFTFSYDGRDVVYDSQGDYDYLRLNGVTNINQVGITHSGNDVFVYKRADAADGYLDEYIKIANYYDGSSYSEGKIELLNVNGSNFSLQDYIVNYWQTA